ncbi:MAG TPA: arginase family protein [Thermoflexales bacterium]|nr:arginase family protein [Thermoflexales bacterium]HQZ21432.1 arginase family protein [Thermoflexales bacterium]
MTNKYTIAIVCVPYSVDVMRWGNSQGPKAFLNAGIAQALTAQGHTVSEPVWVEMAKGERGRDTITNLGNISRRESDAVYAALQTHDRVLVLQGDCTHSPGAAGGLARAKGGAGVVWYDAHGDIHTMQTSETGLWGGMPYGVILGFDFDDWREAAGLKKTVAANAAALIGASDLDPAEEAALTRNHIARLDAKDMMDDGTSARIEGLLKPMANHAPAWYLHLDIDVAGPVAVPGTLTPAPHWPPREQLVKSIGAAARSLPMSVVSLAAYTPSNDPQHKGIELGTEMILAAFSA